AGRLGLRRARHSGRSVSGRPGLEDREVWSGCAMLACDRPRIYTLTLLLKGGEGKFLRAVKPLLELSLLQEEAEVDAISVCAVQNMALRSNRFSMTLDKEMESM